MQSNILYFHLGTPKTGTTALQEFLVSSSESLQKWGLFYPDFGNEIFPHVNGYFFLNYPSKQTMDAHSSEQWEGLWRKIDQYLKKGHVIISNEGFWDRPSTAIYNYAVQRGYRVKFIIYLRRQDLYLESHYNESVKTHYETELFPEWIEKHAYQSDTSNAHYLQQLLELEELVGKENILVRVFEKEQMYGGKMNTILDFMHTLVPEYDEEIQMESSNERLSPDVNEVKRAFNRVISNGSSVVDKDDYLKLFCQLSRVHTDSNTQKRAGYMDETQRRKLMRLYEVENAEIARRYLNREDGRLFYDDNYDLPIIQTTLTSGELLIVEYVSSIYVQLNQKMNQLINASLQEESKLCKIVKKVCNGRKIALFGAGYRCGFYLDQLKEGVDVIIDNNPAKWGTFMDRIRICSAEEILDWSQYFVVITVLTTAHIEEQLQKIGLRRDIDYLIGNEYLSFS